MIRRVGLFILVFLTLAGCSGGGSDPGTAPDPNPLPFCTNGTLSVEVISEHSVVYDSRTFRYRLLRLTCGTNAPSYAQFFLPPSNATSPCVMETMPYDIIDWTGEQVDIDYAAAHGPALDPDALADRANIYQLHGFGVLYVYGRFYTEDSIVNDVNDMIAGLKFLQQEGLADNTKIGITGGSWGGFEAVYGAAYAPVGITPLVGTAYYPPTDYRNWYRDTAHPEDYISSQTKIDEYNNFFAPYLDRIDLYSNGDPSDPGTNFRYFNHSDLRNHLGTEFLVVHDAWDTLVPFDQSLDLHSARPDAIHPFWVYHDTPLDYETFPLSHADLLTNGSSVPAYITWGFVFMFKALAESNQDIFSLYDPVAMNAFCAYVKEYQDKGYDMDWAADRFLELFDDRIRLLNVVTTGYDAGKTVITDAVNTAWGASYSEAELETLLMTGLP